MAIASAVLEHMVTEIACKVLFVTHYLSLATSLAAKYPSKLGNIHMAFLDEEGPNGVHDIRFLYQVQDGLARGSYGIECAQP